MDRRKQLKEQYKARKVVGGVYRIINRECGRFYLHSTDDMQATRNWFAGCYKMESCWLPSLLQDWKAHGKDAFSLEELDVLEKGDGQDDPEYRRDLKVLLELWDEKLPKGNRY